MHSLHFVLADTSAQVAVNRVTGSWSWYTIRASGFLAFGTLFALMISGIGHVTGLTYRVLEPVKAWAVHKAMAIVLGISILVHVGSLLIDHFVPFTLPQIMIPFLKSYTNHTTLLGLNLAWLAIPAGILAMYGSYLVLLSSLETVGWINTRKRLWNWLHYVSYAVMILVFLHALTTGTDLKSGLWRTVAIVLMFLVVLATISRVFRTRALTDKLPD